MTDTDDNNTNMPDALEVAAAQDKQFKQTGRLVGHCMEWSRRSRTNFDMRTTAGADAQDANDRPPEDATFVKRLRSVICHDVNLSASPEDQSGISSADVAPPR
jgi:amidase